MNLAKSMVDNNIVAVSGLIPRRDIFNQKAKEVNENLKCIQRREHSIHFSPQHIHLHLNSRGLHLNEKKIKHS